jgi:hypothetical protein
MRAVKKAILMILTIAFCAVVAEPAAAQQEQAGEMTLDKEEAAKHFPRRGYSPYADRGFPTMPLWGDTHLHTANSPDAFAFGNRLTPFAFETIPGKKFDRAYAETRANWEPVYEITQIKGDGESYPFLSPNDEFAGYELWDKGNLDMSERKTDDMLQYEYAREALKNRPPSRVQARREPFQRITVRFWGGWDFVAADASNRLPAATGYAKGVPMGGDLHSAPKGKAPTFLVAALKDPYSGNLDRIQIVKGWLDAKGKTHEKVYDVVWSDAGSRKPNKDGKLPAVGNTVDVKNATWANTIGDPELITAWKDPDFGPPQSAFYYARVIEIPTPRWTAYDAKRYGIKIDAEVPMSTQERAYTSPIWYTP